MNRRKIIVFQRVSSWRRNIRAGRSNWSWLRICRALAFFKSPFSILLLSLFYLLFVLLCLEVAIIVVAHRMVIYFIIKVIDFNMIIGIILFNAWFTNIRELFLPADKMIPLRKRKHMILWENSRTFLMIHMINLNVVVVLHGVLNTC